MPAQTEPDAEDALVESILDEALAGYERLVPGEVLREIRACLEDRLRAHPQGRSLLRRAMPDPTVERSGDVATEDDDGSAEEGSG